MTTSTRSVGSTVINLKIIKSKPKNLNPKAKPTTQKAGFPPCAWMSCHSMHILSALKQAIIYSLNQIFFVYDSMDKIQEHQCNHQRYHHPLSTSHHMNTSTFSCYFPQAGKILLSFPRCPAYLILISIKRSFLFCRSLVLPTLQAWSR